MIDLSRATVLPGLIDRHVHLMQEQQPNDARAAFSGWHYALKDLNAGFTTLQDMGSPYTYATVELRDAINKGQIPGPRLQVAGPQLNPRAAGYYPAPSVVTPFGQSRWSEYVAALGRCQLSMARPRGRARALALRRRLDQGL